MKSKTIQSLHCSAGTHIADNVDGEEKKEGKKLIGHSFARQMVS